MDSKSACYKVICRECVSWKSLILNCDKSSIVIVLKLFVTKVDSAEGASSEEEEDADCAAVESRCVTLEGVSVILSTSFTSEWLRKVKETQLCLIKLHHSLYLSQ